MTGWLDAHLVSMVDGVAYGLLLFTLAVGLSLVFGMMDVLNLAHGTLYLAGAYAAYALSDGSWLGLLVALVVGLAVGLLGGGLLAAARSAGGASASPCSSTGHEPRKRSREVRWCSAASASATIGSSMWPTRSMWKK